MADIGHLAQAPAVRRFVRPLGDLDLASAPRLGLALLSAGRRPETTVVLDLSRVAFMDCAALGELLRARDALGGRLALCGVPSPVALLLRLTELTTEFPVVAVDPARVPSPRPGTPLTPERETNVA